MEIRYRKEALMQHFFVDPSAIEGSLIRISGDDVNHIKNVLRMKPGEEVSISTGMEDREYRAEITELKDDEIICTLRFIKEKGVELPVRLTLFQGLPKADKMDLIIQKAVELGVSRIVPVRTDRAVVKLDDKKAAAKRERWQKIAEAAAKQSGRAYIPEVSLPSDIREALKEAAAMDAASIPYELAEGMEDTKAFVKKVRELADKKEGTAGIFIGPEGGFTKEEIELAVSNGIKPVSLGRRILRTETAGLMLLSVLMYELEL